MSWLTLNTDRIKGRLSNSELEAYVDAGEHARNGIDVLEEIIFQVVALVRSKVAANSDNLSKMGPSGSIPEEALFAACTIARDALVGSLPLSEGASEVRKEELRKAHEFLDAMAKGEIMIENPLGEIPETTPQFTASYGGVPLYDF